MPRDGELSYLAAKPATRFAPDSHEDALAPTPTWLEALGTTPVSADVHLPAKTREPHARTAVVELGSVRQLQTHQFKFALRLRIEDKLP